MPDNLVPTFRPVGDRDRELLHRIFISSWDRAIALADWPPETKKKVLEQQFHAQEAGYHSTHPEAAYDLIIVEGEVVGRLYVRREADEIGLMDITLLPGHRNRGIGSIIMQMLKAEASNAGRRLGLYVEKWNPGARRFYARHGFTELEDIGSHWRMQWLPTLEDRSC